MVTFTNMARDIRNSIAIVQLIVVDLEKLHKAEGYL